MKDNVYFTPELEKKFQAYRDRRRVERGGKVLQRNTALHELIEFSLAGEKPKAVIDLAAFKEAAEYMLFVVHSLARQLDRARMLPEGRDQLFIDLDRVAGRLGVDLTKPRV